jgi:selenocysteine lyase/cysteine desulfurase
LDRRVGVVSLSIEGCVPQELALVLDASRRIQVRAGLHCAPAMHRALGTFAAGGTLRLSWGPFNTPEQIDLAVESIVELTARERGVS